MPCLGWETDVKTKVNAPFIESDFLKNKLFLGLWPVALIELQCFQYRNLLSCCKSCKRNETTMVFGKFSNGSESNFSCIS